MVSHVASYIDPGTGSMLFTLAVGLLSAGYFFLRKVAMNVRFFMSGGRAEKQVGERLPFLIFSDDKRYWNVFEPVCDEFERRGIPLAYWTASPDDPALQESYEHVTCEFIGEGNRAFAKLNMAAADVVLATTPGLDVYQWKRSKDVRYYAHVLHAVGSAAGYRMFGIDFFDAVLLSGQFQVDEVRELEALRGLPPKELPIVGCTYLDQMDKQLAELHEYARKDATPSAEPHTTTVLLAPSWGPSAILSVYGEKIINALVATGYNVVIRPHPQSKTADAEVLEALMAKFPGGEAVEWNFDNNNFSALDRADVMVTDFSGVVFDYALVFDKPIIYTEGQFDAAPYDAWWLDHPLWKFNVYPTLGVPLDEAQFSHMKEVVDAVMADGSLAKGRERAREEVWAHRGESVVRTVDWLVAKHDELVAEAAAEVTAEQEDK